jgi:1,4-dihydroxy-6-naphthoate synthase
LVARSSKINLASAKIAVPGRYTTAYLLLKLWHPGALDIEFTRFDNIMEGVQSGKYDAGLIIHEGRFVYENYNLKKIIDLGEWWEKETKMPIPLGCIAIRKDDETIAFKQDVEAVIRYSINYAFHNRNASREYIKSHAQELEDNVIDGHIELYVNEFSLSLGVKGIESIRVLRDMAKRSKII